MVKLENLLKAGKLSRISDLEIGRYINFFENSYKDNLLHSEYVIEAFPRWSIISGYYAMHDITKLLLAKKFRLKIERKVHATAIEVMHELIKDTILLQLLEKGYAEFLHLASDLEEAKAERTKVQYYTGTPYLNGQYKKNAMEFHNNTVKPYLKKIRVLLK
ncbi:MAG: hypothetical protein QME12_02990 [Nanoarchaeota archaeon]|nr:hypothetical protein [Nanoarchaeota archaeon]